MKKLDKTTFLLFGGGAMLATFGILCMVVLAMLSITSARSDRHQAESSNQNVAEFYAADRHAQNIYARLKLGETVEDVLVDGNIYRYTCPVSENQVLEVELEKTDEGWKVLRWQAVSTEQQEEGTIPAGEADP